MDWEKNAWKVWDKKKDQEEERRSKYSTALTRYIAGNKIVMREEPPAVQLCAHCDIGGGIHPLRRCMGCMAVAYCCRSHQQIHWQWHKVRGMRASRTRAQQIKHRMHSRSTYFLFACTLELSSSRVHSRTIHSLCIELPIALASAHMFCDSGCEQPGGAEGHRCWLGEAAATSLASAADSCRVLHSQIYRAVRPSNRAVP